MKKLLYLSLVVLLMCCISCSEDFLSDQNLPDDVAIDMELSKKAPEYGGITLPNNFSSYIFYDGITGPDGLHVLNKNKLLVGKEYGGKEGIYLAKRGTTFNPGRDAFSTLGFNSPDDITADMNGVLYVADGQAFTVFKITRNGRPPTVFVTRGSETTNSFDPFGVTIAPSGFDGPNVDPGDLIVCDNAGGDASLWGVWAVNRATGLAKVLAQGSAFENGPINAAFNSEGTLFVSLNNGGSGPNKLVTLLPYNPNDPNDPYGKIAPFADDLSAPFIAIHPLTDDIYCKKNTTQLHFIPKGGGASTLFATNVGVNDDGTQDMAFNKQGTALYICHRDEKRVIEIYSHRNNW